MLNRRRCTRYPSCSQSVNMHISLHYLNGSFTESVFSCWHCTVARTVSVSSCKRMRRYVHFLADYIISKGVWCGGLCPVRSRLLVLFLKLLAQAPPLTSETLSEFQICKVTNFLGGTISFQYTNIIMASLAKCFQFHRFQYQLTDTEYDQEAVFSPNPMRIT